MLLEKLWMWLAWKAPRRFVYWTVVRAVAHGTTGEYAGVTTPSVTASEILARWRLHR